MDKYAVWIAREMKKNPEILHNPELYEVFDWAKSTSPNILKISYEEAVVESNKWHAMLIENSKNKRNTRKVDSSRILYTCSDGKHFIYTLTIDELKAEGEQMGHCVGTNDFYAKRMKKGELKIISLRDEDNQPHVTFEIDILRGNSGQISGKGNDSPISKYNDFITEFAIFLASDSLDKEDVEKLNRLSKLK